MKWYNVDSILSYNAIISMVIGMRGPGKSFSCKVKAVNNFIKKKEKFIYLRRYQKEIDEIKETIFADVNQVKGWEVKYKQDKYWIGDDIIGYAMGLSTADDYRSASFPDVSLIIFDEFIIDGKNPGKKYLKNEVFKFLNLYETVARTRENVRAVLLGNSFSMVNPYTEFWGININDNANIIKAQDGLVVVQKYQDSSFQELKRATKYGRLIKGTEFERMAVDNEFIEDSPDMVEEINKKGWKYLFTIVDEKDYAVWYKLNERLYYVDDSVDPSCKLRFSFDKNYHAGSDVLVTISEGVLKNFVRAFKLGCIFYKTQFIKKKVYMLISKYAR